MPRQPMQQDLWNWWPGNHPLHFPHPWSAPQAPSRLLLNKVCQGRSLLSNRLVNRTIASCASTVAGTLWISIRDAGGCSQNSRRASARSLYSTLRRPSGMHLLKSFPLRNSHSRLDNSPNSGGISPLRSSSERRQSFCPLLPHRKMLSSYQRLRIDAHVSDANRSHFTISPKLLG